MPILQIGELAKQLTDQTKLENPNVPWKEAVRIRDFLAHHYWRMDYEIMWETSQESIAHLQEALLMIHLEWKTNDKTYHLR